MAREGFLNQLSSCIRFDRQLASNGGTWVKSNGSKDVLARLVSEFEPAQFDDLPSSLQRTLVDSMEKIENSDGKEASNGIGRLVELLGPIVREEWRAAIEQLAGLAEEWSAKRDWPTRRYPKTVEDDLLGTYSLPQLLIHTLQARVLLDPIDRFVVGGTGLVDLYAMPSLVSRSLIRQPGGWMLRSATPRGRMVSWSEEAFETAVQSLAREAA